ncbi:hypothetical protein [Streptomyces sp. NPDC004728]|uniref:hypothetical protein n=1 Tax=Streptomyces sp. NPDC004728 TaxID=3154289 RepID=UPI0033BC5243
MALPVHHRPGHLTERAFPSLGWGEPIGAEFGDLFERMNHFLEQAATVRSYSGTTWSACGPLNPWTISN